MAKFANFIGDYYTATSPWADQEDLVNFYVENIESGGGSSKKALYPTPGVTLYNDGNQGGVGRAHFFQNGREFAVIGPELVEITQYGIDQTRGTVAADEYPATICGNGDSGGQLLITSGGNAYHYNLTTNTLTQIAAFNGIAQMGGFVDGYGLILDSTTSTLYVSDLFDMSTWDPTQYAQNSATSDRWVALGVSNRLIYLLGSETGQIWFNEGTFPFPFSLHPSGVINFGTIAPFSLHVTGSAIYWISRTVAGAGAVVRTSGYQVEVVSNYAVHNAMENYVTMEDAIGDSYEDQGHTFYILTFPKAEATWHYDPGMNSWGRRGTWRQRNYRFEAWRPIFQVFAFGEHRCLDLKGTGIYKMSREIGTDVEGVVIRRVRRAPAIVNENKRMFFPAFELDCEPGLALANGQGSDPQVMMRMSNDRGKTWGDETFRSAGKRGEYFTRVMWNRCGSGRGKVFEVAFTDPVPWRIINAYLPDIREGAS
jgi:hypothetical protein